MGTGVGPDLEMRIFRQNVQRIGGGRVEFQRKDMDIGEPHGEDCVEQQRQRTDFRGIAYVGTGRFDG